MSELNQEELLDWFVNYINTRAIPLDHMKKFKQIVALIQKPQVTEEWIEEKATELFAKHSIGFPTPKMIVILKDFIQLLERL